MAKKRCRTPKVKVVYRKLGREKAYGQAIATERLIEIDEGLKPKKMLRILAHEAAHVALPELSESQISKLEKVIGDVLWQENYRKVSQ